VNRGDQRFVFTIGKHGILLKNDRVSGRFMGFAETIFQNALYNPHRPAVQRRYLPFSTSGRPPPPAAPAARTGTR
jgi:hypothetical protein